MASFHAVILAGGSGTRFWPASRQARPKQFLPLAHGKPLLQAAVDRTAGLCPPERIWIATNARQAEALPRVLPSFPRSQVIVEPEPRDTAPGIALAVATIGARDPDATMAVLPSDHVIEPQAEFERMLRRGIALAADGTSLVVYGIAPTNPATGYGYLQLGALVDAGDPPAARVARFREKPDRVTAERLVAEGCLWNAGIFTWSIAAIRAAMRAANAELSRATESMLEALRKGDRDAALRAFASAPKTSIDFAVMEKAERVVAVRAPVRWDDVGSFPALAAVGRTDASGNVAVTAGGASWLSLESEGNVVYAEGERTVALFGVRDLAVVAVGDAVLVCPKDKAADLKALVDHVKAQGRVDLL